MNAKDNSNNQWSHKFQELVQACQTELKKTTQIGMKMLSASQSNTLLKECYEELGQLVVNAMGSKELTWQNEKVEALITKIHGLQEDLKNFETDVQNIKKEV